MIEENVQVRVIGQQDRLPTHTRRAMEKAMEETKENTGLILNFALNYGSRDEIVSAVQHMMKDREEGKVRVEDVSEEMLSSYLMTSSLPDPELLIRTSGELRISNFMLWQISVFGILVYRCVLARFYRGTFAKCDYRLST